MNEWLTQIVTLLPEGGAYLALIATIAFFEALPLIGLLVPGSTLIVLAGFLSAQGKGDLTGLIPAAMGGAFCGDFLSYWLGGRLGQKLLNLPLIRRGRRRFKEADVFFKNHGGKSLFYARFLGPIRGTIPFLAGMAHMKPGYFSWASLISAILWGISYPGIGYLGGESWQQATHLSSRLGLIIFIAFCASLFHLWLRRKAGRTQKK